jgi:hypothetical protein
MDRARGGAQHQRRLYRTEKIEAASKGLFSPKATKKYFERVSIFLFFNIKFKK